MRGDAMGLFSLSGSFTKPQHGPASLEMATVGLHDRLYEILLAHAPAPPYRLLDLGSGTGGWGRRIIEAGNEARGVNLDPEKCLIPSVKADLNHPFSDKFDERFDAVTCIEVIEHLENPRNVFREAAKLLKPGGLFLVSTPNASGLYSRLKFFFVGRFAMFDELQYGGIGHITPVTHWQLIRMFRENGFAIEAVEDFDATPRFPNSLGDAIKIMARLLRPLMRGHVGTQNLIMVGRYQG
jgi:2-polyprenyl-3-methyl-5-hydroxy-6-metoxy-1,4-benzoquinol methylase